MTSQPASGDEADRIALLRDPPAPPGYVDPLEASPTLEKGLAADARGSGRPTGAASEAVEPGGLP